ncbi:5'-nucleotidase/2',3'-cyclic phosphodiesterase and related esterase [Nitzschia inconspicua]|uniref:5'-nucleotidase/2',3'-cyclic phosphodiesterase and related esterase n=1 Tax=Nitzschia inconspicua TaxID=303405 RepID=A0A9K3M7S4_9STRA|nr:5'-nucleotidase/2',3'-cyclic phosphodiesterase and related esterase [Nitzschia inconspicua]
MSSFQAATIFLFLSLVGRHTTVVQADDATGASFSLKILHLNDHHSHLAEETFSIATAALDPSITTGINITTVEQVTVKYGGFPRLVTLFQQLEDESTTDATLKVHAGDAFAGTLFFTLFEGTADASVMAPICFDAMTLGNHEFDLGNDRLEEFIVQLDQQTSGACNEPTRILSANVQAPPSSMLESQLVPYIIKDYGDEQVAVVGLTTSVTTLTSQPDADTVFAEEVAALEGIVTELEDMGINKIVVVTHVGFEIDTSAIAAVDGVDVVIGGHSHTLLGDESLSILGGNVGGSFPTMQGVTTCVVTAWEYAHGLGEVDVVFDSDGNVVSCEGSIQIPYDNTAYEPAEALDETFTTGLTAYLGSFNFLVPAQPDEDMATLVEQYEAEIFEFGDDVIATVPADICYERIPGQGRSSICTPEETSTQGGGACNLVAKAFLDQAPSADVAIQNGGGCRVDIAAGDYTVNDAFTLLPFSNTLVSLEMTGAEIIQVLNIATSIALSGESSGAYPYASGLRYDVDGNNFEMPISNVEVNVRLEGTWTLINDSEIYTVVTNDFIAAGGDGYVTFTEVEEVTDLFLEYANTFVRYCQKVGTLLDPPLSEYSTKSFIPREEVSEPTVTPAEEEEATVSPTSGPVGSDEEAGEQPTGEGPAEDASPEPSAAIATPNPAMAIFVCFLLSIPMLW